MTAAQRASDSWPRICYPLLTGIKRRSSGLSQELVQSDASPPLQTSPTPPSSFLVCKAG